MNKKKILMALTMLFMSCILAGCGKTEIDLSQFVSVRYEGVNGEATATVDFDFPAFEEAIWKYEEETEETIIWIMTFEESIKIELDKAEKLSNGDTIIATIRFNEETSKKAKYNFSGITKEFKVDSLKDAIVLDIFEGLEINYNTHSISPYIELYNFTSKSSDINNLIDFSTEKKDNLKNGEKIIVTATYDEEEVLKKGYVVEQKEKEFIVEGLDEYISTFEQLDDKIKSELQEEALKQINVHLDGKYGYFFAMYPNIKDITDKDYESVTIQNIELKSNYFFYPKEIEKVNPWTGINNNELYFIYQVNGTDCFQPEGAICYIVIYFDDIIQKADGSYIIGKGNVRESFTDWEQLYEEKIEKSKENYNIEEITEYSF